MIPVTLSPLLWFWGPGVATEPWANGSNSPWPDFCSYAAAFVVCTSAGMVKNAT